MIDNIELHMKKWTDTKYERAENDLKPSQTPSLRWYSGYMKISLFLLPINYMNQAIKIIDEMNEFLDSNGILSVDDIVGSVKPWQ